MDKLILTDGDVIDHAGIEKVTYWNGLVVKTSGNWDLTRGARCSSAWHWLEEGIPLVEVPQTVRNLLQRP